MTRFSHRLLQVKNALVPRIAQFCATAHYGKMQKLKPFSSFEEGTSSARHVPSALVIFSRKLLEIFSHWTGVTPLGRLSSVIWSMLSISSWKSAKW